MTLLLALVLGIVEGLTEFLPISSTGHLILVSHLFGFEGPKAEVFEIFIQLGAVIAVAVEFRARLGAVVADLPRRPEARRFVAALAVAFAPAAVVGLLFHKTIQERLFGPVTVAAALLAGAVLILAVEARRWTVRTHRAEETGLPQALAVGTAQCLSLWPGFSRSAATILGGMAAGLDRRAATEFSFFLSIPTLGAATVYSLYKHIAFLDASDLHFLALSTAVSFVVAWISIRWLLRFVSTHTLRPFAWYRIALGLLVLWIVR